MKICVYPGSFDPVSNGHLDIINRISKLFDKVYILVANNPAKHYTFTPSERCDFIQRSTTHLNNVEVCIDHGLVLDFAKKVGANAIIRGLRNPADFQDEFTLFNFNRSIDSNIETILLFSSPDNLFLSSSAIKELVMFKSDISKYVPSCIKDDVIKKLEK